MNNTQRILIHLLSNAMRGKRIDGIDEAVDWRDVFEAAKKHKVSALLFPVIDSLKGSCRPDDDMIAEWKNTAVAIGIAQFSQMNNIMIVLNKFHDAGIPVILLKGLVLRDYYPEPDLREMLDADILVQTADIQKAKAILLSMDYYIRDEHDLKEIHFVHKKNLSIEIHWRVSHPESAKNIDWFENEIWENKKSSSFMGIPVNILSVDDLLIHLFIHMVFHLNNSSGFGLRPLADFALMVEKNIGSIDWGKFVERTKILRIERFSQAILLLCKKLFNISLPAIAFSIDENDSFINYLIDDILQSGHFSNKTTEWKRVNELLVYNKKTDNNYTKNKFLLYFKIIFPPIKILAPGYKYLYKTPFLYPIAWISRLLNNIFKRKVVSNVQERFSFNRKSYKMYKQREDLLKWLDLRQ